MLNICWSLEGSIQKSHSREHDCHWVFKKAYLVLIGIRFLLPHASGWNLSLPWLVMSFQFQNWWFNITTKEFFEILQRSPSVLQNISFLTKWHHDPKKTVIESFDDYFVFNLETYWNSWDDSDLRRPYVHIMSLNLYNEITHLCGYTLHFPASLSIFVDYCPSRRLLPINMPFSKHGGKRRSIYSINIRSD